MSAANLRLPEDLHRQITETAKRSQRSLNGEIVHRLQRSFEQQQEVKAVSSLIRKALQGEGS